MHFIFIQPELRTSTSSHYFQYIKSIRSRLEVKGHTTQLIANELFLDNSYADPELAFKNRPVKKADPISVLNRIAIENTKSYFEYKNLFRKLAIIYPSAIFFVDTVQNDRVIALAASFQKIKKEYPSIRLVVVFRFTYGSNSKGLIYLQKLLHKLFVKITNSSIRNNDCLLLTDSTLLKDMYEENLGKKIELLPIPLATEMYESALLNIPKQLFGITTIGFIGGVVAYKGLDRFLKMIVNLRSPNVQLIIHGVSDIDDLLSFAQTVLDPAAYLIFQSRLPQIKTYYRPDESAYLNMLRSMDVILIPYTSLQFKEGTSNIFTEAISLQVIPIVPVNTWMAAELTKAGLSELSVDFSQQEILETLLDSIIREKDVYFKKITEWSAKWRKFHAAENFSDNLLLLLNTTRNNNQC